MKLRRDLLFLIVILAVVGLLYYLSTKKTKIPAMPGDAVHVTGLQTKSRDDCLKCHTAETLGQLELQHKHPGKWSDKRVACTLCHNRITDNKAELDLPGNDQGRESAKYSRADALRLLVAPPAALSKEPYTVTTAQPAIR